MLRVRFFCCCCCCCSLFLFVLFCFVFFHCVWPFGFFGFVVVLVNFFHLRSAKYTEVLHTMKDLKSGKGLWSFGRRPWDGWWSMCTNQQMWIHFLTIFQWFSQRNFLLQALGKKNSEPLLDLFAWKNWLGRSSVWTCTLTVGCYQST